MPTKTKTHLTATVIKADDLPADVVKAADGEDIDKWFYATVEVKDREGDIVRVDGIDLAKYAGEGRSIKFVSNHRRSPSDDGRLPIVGKAVKWSKTVHKGSGAKALAVGVKFAPTALGQEMKTLYDGEFLSDVSIGFESTQAVPIPGAGLDYQKSAIGEFSACITGMNQYAAVVRALEKEQPEHWQEVVGTGEFIKATQDILSHLKEINIRLDDLESAIVGTAKEAKQPADQKTSPEDENAPSLADFVNAIKAIAPRKK